MNLDAQVARASSRASARSARETPGGWSALVEQDDARVEDRCVESFRSNRRDSSASCPASSTPVGPAPTTTNVSQRSCTAGSISRSAISKMAEIRLELEGVVDRTDSRRLARELGMSENRTGAPPSRHNQAVVEEQAALTNHAGRSAPSVRNRCRSLPQVQDARVPLAP